MQHVARRHLERAVRVLRAGLAPAALAVLILLPANCLAGTTEQVDELIKRPSEPNQAIHQLARQARLTRGGPKARLERIIDQIFDEKSGLGFTYKVRPTLTAAEAVEAKEGNCLTLVNLVVSIARTAGIDAEYVKVEDFETFHRHRGTIVRTTHVIGGIKVGRYMLYVDFLPGRQKPYRQLKPISDRRAAALFYNALATEAMLEIDLDLAATYFRDALSIDGQSAEIWNNFAVLQRRQGNLNEAIESLHRAHQLDPTLLPAIENLAGMYTRDGRLEEARLYEELALQEKTRNPFFLLQQAVDLLGDGDFTEAQNLLRRARRLEPDEPEILVALGRAALGLGNTREAGRFFSLAKKKSKARTAGFQMLLKKKIDRLLIESEQAEDE